MKTKFYLTENGNILNVGKGCFQTAGGQFLRRVFDEEMEYLVGVLTPIRAPKDFPEPELPVWELLWDIEGEYLNENNELEPCLRSCYTRKIEGKDREFYILIFPENRYTNVEIVDTDESPIYVEDEEVGRYEYKKAELIEYAYKSSLEEVYKLGEPDLEERTRRYKILKEKGIEFPPISQKRQRKPRK